VDFNSRAHPPRSGDCDKCLAPTSPPKDGSEVDNQVAAPTELSTPTLQRARIAHNGLRMEGWRQRRLGSKERIHRSKNKTVLTLTGLLMEGIYAVIWRKIPFTTLDSESAHPDNKRIAPMARPPLAIDKLQMDFPTLHEPTLGDPRKFCIWGHEQETARRP